MTGVKRSAKMSLYEGDSHVEREGTEEANGSQQGRGEVDGGRGGGGGAGGVVVWRWGGFLVGGGQKRRCGTEF